MRLLPNSLPPQRGKHTYTDTRTHKFACTHLLSATAAATAAARRLLWIVSARPLQQAQLEWQSRALRRATKTEKCCATRLACLGRHEIARDICGPSKRSALSVRLLAQVAPEIEQARAPLQLASIIQ